MDTGNRRLGRVSAVECVETGEVFASQVEAARSAGVTSDAIYHAARFGSTCAGRHWRYPGGRSERRASHARPVTAVETGDEYPSVAAAAVAAGVTPPAIIRALRFGGTCAGMHWSYLEQEVHEPGETALPADGGSERPQNVSRAGRTRRIGLVCVETGEEFPSINAAARATGIPNVALSSAASGIAGGYHWLRLDSAEEAPNLGQEIS